MSMELRAREGIQEIIVGADLDATIRNHRYYPDLGTSAGSDQIVNAMEIAATKIALDDRILAHLDVLRELVRTQSGEVSKRERRRQFLLRLISRPQEYDVLGRSMKIAGDVIRDRLDAKYNKHPETERTLVVDLGSSNYVLSELDEVAQATQAQQNSSDINTYDRVLGDARRTNMFRRILVYYEPCVMLDFLSTTHADTKSVRDNAHVISLKLRELLENAQQDHLVVKALVANRGGRPLAFRGLGVLYLRVPLSEEGDNAVIKIPIGGVEQDAEIIVVDPGKPEVVEFISDSPMRDVVNANPMALGGSDWSRASKLEDSRFSLLWRANSPSLKAKLILARAGLDPRDAVLGVSEETPVGRSSRDVILKELLDHE